MNLTSSQDSLCRKIQANIETWNYDSKYSLQNSIPSGSELCLLWNGTHESGDHEDQDFSLPLGSKTFENNGNPAL